MPVQLNGENETVVSYNIEKPFIIADLQIWIYWKMDDTSPQKLLDLIKFCDHTIELGILRTDLVIVK